MREIIARSYRASARYQVQIVGKINLAAFPFAAQRRSGHVARILT